MPKRPLAAALLVLAAAAGSDDVRTTVAIGRAAFTGDVLAARDQAKDDALRSCVQQVATTVVTAASEADQAQLLSDEIYAHPVGYVRRLQVLEDRQDGDAWITRLRCEVSEAKLEEDMLAFGIAHRRAGMPRVLALVAEQAVDATQATGWWQGGGNAADLRVVESAFRERMERSGFTFVDPELLQGKAKLEAVGADPGPQQAREIGVKAGAELVVVGRAVARPVGELRLESGTFYAAVADVSARAVRTDTGEIVARVEFTGTAGRGFERATAGRNAFSEAGRQLARVLFAQVGRVWTRAQSGARRIAMAVSGVNDYARLAAFKSALVQQVRGVEDVQERSMESGRAELVVTVTGTSRSFATDLATRKLQGFSLEVKKVTEGALEVELR